MLYVINEDDECLCANLLRNVANYNITAWPGSADLHLLPASHGVSIEAVKHYSSSSLLQAKLIGSQVQSSQVITPVAAGGE